jgi:heptosyltransferase-2
LFFKNEIPPAGIKTIVVYTVGILGDNVVMLPALAALRRHYSQAKITVITNCQSWGTQIAEGILGPSSLKDGLITLSEDPVRRSGCTFLMDREKFAGVDCDLFVNLSPFGNRGWFGAVIREMAFARLLGARYAVGFRMSTLSRRRLFNDVQYRFVKNEPRRYRDVIEQLGLSSPLTEDLLGHNEEARQSIAQKLKTNKIDSGNFFVVNPGAKFIAKCWPTERFGKVAEYVFTEYDGSVVVTGTSAERAIAEDVVRFSGGTAVNLADETTVPELIELLRLAKGCITNDTGTMHIAAMIGVPTVAIFSLRHSPTHWLPLGNRIVSVFSIPPCHCCYDDYCTTGECLQAIESSTVIEQVKRLFPLPLTDKKIADHDA